MNNEVLTPEIMTPVTPEQEASIALNKAMEVLTKAKTVIIKNQHDYAEADASLAALKNMKKSVEKMRVGWVKPLNDTVDKFNAQAKKIVAPIDEAIKCYTEPMTAFQAEQTRRRQEAEAAARKERERLEAEARAKADAEIAAAKLAREEADKARAATEGEEDPLSALLAEDEAAEAEARANEQAEAARAAIREMATIEVQPALVVPKVTGSASKTFTVWEFEITDPALVPLKYRPIDTAAITRDVKAGKDECKIPGVRVFSRIEVK